MSIKQRMPCPQSVSGSAPGGAICASIALSTRFCGRDLNLASMSKRSATCFRAGSGESGQLACAKHSTPSVTSPSSSGYRSPSWSADAANDTVRIRREDHAGVTRSTL